MKYGIVQAGKLKRLHEMVQKALDDGWELAGGVSVSTYGFLGRKIVYAQAFIKKD